MARFRRTMLPASPSFNCASRQAARSDDRSVANDFFAIPSSSQRSILTDSCLAPFFVSVISRRYRRKASATLVCSAYRISTNRARDISPSISVAHRWASALVSKVAEMVGWPLRRISARQASPRRWIVAIGEIVRRPNEVRQRGLIALTVPNLHQMAPQTKKA